MSELIVLAFDKEDGAAKMLDEIGKLQQGQLIALDDAALVVRKADGKVKVKQAQNLVGAGAMGGAFWGLLIGLLFWAPWLGLGIGALTGALSGKAADIGIDDRFIKDVGAGIEPGNSALFLMVRSVTADKVLEDLQKFPGTRILRTSLTEEQEQRLRDAFAADDLHSTASA